MAEVRSLIHQGAARLAAAGLAHARHEVEWLLSRLVGTTPLQLYLQESSLPKETVEHFFSQISARASGVPLQYLLGEAEFFGERFAVAPGVFIPRPETEHVVEAALQILRERSQALARPLRLLDLGTGSGCIAVTLARALPTCVVVGVEVSWHALGIAKRNIQRHGVGSRVWLVQGHWGEPIGGGFDGVISNPPYIPSEQVEHLPLDVRQEPRVSLDGGLDGMRELTHLLGKAPRLLRDGGLLALECGDEQLASLAREAALLPWAKAVTTIRDLASRPRGLLITKSV